MLNLSSMPTPYSNTDLLQHALIGLEHRKTEIDQAITGIRSRLRGAGPKLATVPANPNRPTVKHHSMSAAARKRMSRLMKRRWTNAKKAGKKGL